MKKIKLKTRAFYQHKLVLIAGGSSGIGLAIAEQLAACGARVVIMARRELQLQEARQQILEKFSSAQVFMQVLDVENLHSCQSCIGQIIETHGNIDILINCAGRALPDYFVNISAQQFAQTLKLNVGGAYNLAKVIVPHFIENQAGYLLNTASVAGFLGVFGYTDYCASKFALVGFSEALQQELQCYNIKVAVLFPPDTQTAGFAQEELSKPVETRAVSAANKIMQPEAVASYVIKKIPSNSLKIIPSLDAKISYYAKRYLPALVDFIMLRSIKKAQQDKK